MFNAQCRKLMPLEPEFASCIPFGAFLLSAFPLCDLMRDKLEFLLSWRMENYM